MHLPERLVRARRHQRGPVRGEREVEDAVRVSEQLRAALHARELPDDDLVVGVAVAGDKLLVLGSPDQGANLEMEIIISNIHRQEAKSSCL